VDIDPLAAGKSVTVHPDIEASSGNVEVTIGVLMPILSGCGMRTNRVVDRAYNIEIIDCVSGNTLEGITVRQGVLDSLLPAELTIETVLIGIFSLSVSLDKLVSVSTLSITFYSDNIVEQPEFNTVGYGICLVPDLDSYYLGAFDIACLIVRTGRLGHEEFARAEESCPEGEGNTLIGRSDHERTFLRKGLTSSHASHYILSRCLTTAENNQAITRTLAVLCDILFRSRIHFECPCACIDRLASREIEVGGIILVDVIDSTSVGDGRDDGNSFSFQFILKLLCGYVSEIPIEVLVVVFGNAYSIELLGEVLDLHYLGLLVGGRGVDFYAVFKIIGVYSEFETHLRRAGI
jgi:hypothetical protein